MFPQLSEYAQEAHRALHAVFDDLPPEEKYTYDLCFYLCQSAMSVYGFVYEKNNRTPQQRILRAGTATGPFFMQLVELGKIHGLIPPDRKNSLSEDEIVRIRRVVEKYTDDFDSKGFHIVPVLEIEDENGKKRLNYKTVSGMIIDMSDYAKSAERILQVLTEQAKTSKK